MIQTNVPCAKRRIKDSSDQRKKVKKIKLINTAMNSESISENKLKNKNPVNQKKKIAKKINKKQDIESAKKFHIEIDSNIIVSKEDVREEICAEDPFVCHFNRNLPKDKMSELDNISNWTRKVVTWSHTGRIEVKVPVIDKTNPSWVKSLLDEDDDKPTPLPTIGIMPEPHPKAFDAISHGFVEERLMKNINQKIFSGFQSEIFTIISNYIDFWHTEAIEDKWEKIRRVYSIHCLNHVLKSKKQMTKNNNQLKLVKEGVCPPYLEDQGFTRPRILILLPFKHSAYRVINIMISLLGMEVMYKKKFETEFGPPEDKNKIKDKPEDFYKIFAGDISEDFRIGISVTKSTVKLFSNFKKCDIIIASPLGMRYMLEVANNSYERNILSSIEVFVMDQADIFLMQNWEHIGIILDAMSKCPNEFQGMDFDMYRIHRWHYNNLAHHYRQTIVFSSTSSDHIRSVMSKARNFAGKITVFNPQPGVLPDLKIQADLTLLRITNPNIDEYDSRFAYFTKELLPTLRKNAKSHILIYVPDHFDYLRLVEYFKHDGGTSVATINEYMIEENDKVAKARSLFFDGKRPFLLYTERFHFYRRYKIKGVRHVLFYAPPTYRQFFKEISELLSDEYQNGKEHFSGHSTIYLPYQAADIGKIIELIGTTKMMEIEKSGKNYHSYLTGIDL